LHGKSAEHLLLFRRDRQELQPAVKFLLIADARLGKYGPGIGQAELDAD
jgi:hypothetical protein